jgi:hypothetical protein
MADDEGFFSRWSRRKVQEARGEAPPAGPPGRPQAGAAAVPPPAPPPRAQAEATSAVADAAADPGPGAAPAAAPPTLEEARSLTPEADFSRFVARDVDPQVRNTALKALFRDPRFNVMDGLDIYIDDYSVPDPLPAGMLRRMAQSAALGLLRDTPPAPGPGGAPMVAQTDTEPAASATAQSQPAEGADPPHSPTAAAAAAPEPADHEDPDLRLQPLDAAGRPGDLEGAAGHAGRQR